VFTLPVMDESFAVDVAWETNQPMEAAAERASESRTQTANE